MSAKYVCATCYAVVMLQFRHENHFGKGFGKHRGLAKNATITYGDAATSCEKIAVYLVATTAGNVSRGP